MGANCSNCNCNRDEKEHEVKIEEKSLYEGQGNQNRALRKKVLDHEQSFQGAEDGGRSGH